MLESENAMPDFDIEKHFEKLVLSCPTCGVTLSEQLQCRRCHTDLREIMKTATQAWKLRNQARVYLLAGNFEKSLQCIHKAQRFQRTSYGELIERLATCGAMLQHE